MTVQKGGGNMSTTTENYGLILPEQEDTYDVTAFNGNFNTLDAVVASTEQEIGAVSDKIGSATDENDNTIFSRLNAIAAIVEQGSSLIKSIQRVTASLSIKNESKTETINTVDTSRCIVISEILCQTSYPYSFSYALNSGSLSVSTTSADSGTLYLGFWIIEFY